MSKHFGVTVRRRRWYAAVAALATMSLLAAVSAFAQQGTWTPPRVLSVAGEPALSPEVTMDGAGNAMVLWNDGATILATRYDAATDTWSTPFNLGAQSPAHSQQVALNPGGDGLAVWVGGGNIQAASYRASTGTWSSPATLSVPVGTYALGRVWIDAVGDGMAVWAASQPGLGSWLEAARFNGLTGTWAVAAAIVPLGAEIRSLALAVAPNGDAMVMWHRDVSSVSPDRVQASRFTAATGAWDAVVDVSPAGAEGRSPQLGVDAAGNAVAVWVEGRPGRVRAARYSAATTTWSNGIDLAPLEWGCDPVYPNVGVAPGGTATAIWCANSGGTGVAHYEPATETWGAPLLLSQSGYAQGVGVDAEGNAVAVWLVTGSAGSYRVYAAHYYSGSASWSAPLIVSPDRQGAAFLKIAVGSVGNAAVVWGEMTYNPLSATVLGATFQPPVPPEPPEALSATAVVGNIVTIAWTTPSTGLRPTGYVLEGGLSEGEVLASIPTGSTAPAFTFVAPTGAFYIRVHAVAGTLRSAPSNEIRIFVNVPAVPSPPTNLLGLVNGSTIALSWTNTFAGGAPTSLWLNVAGALTTALPLPMGEAFTYANVPPGTYTLSVIAANASGVSAPSNAVTLTFPEPCTGVPGMPTNLQTWKVGNTISLSWDPPASGPAVASYTVWVGGAYVGSFGTVGRTLSGAAGPGSYVLSVTADNACGAGAATPTQTVVIP